MIGEIEERHFGPDGQIVLIKYQKRGILEFPEGNSTNRIYRFIDIILSA
jgi:hypothetical protein